MRPSSMPVITALTLVTTAALTQPVAAQDSRWSLDFQAGVATPTSDIGEDELGAGFGFEGAVAYRFQPHLAGYAGWDWHQFSPDESFAGSNADFEETGYAFGLRFEHPLGSESGDGAAYRLRAGGTWNHIEIEDEAGEPIADSGHGLGWEAGVGVTFPLGDRWRMVPEVRFRSLTRDVEVMTDVVEIELRYVAFELGFSRRF